MSAFSKTGLDRMHRTMAAHVGRGSVPGLVTLLARGGDVDVGVHGARSVGGPPMSRDSIFRISSMSKPVTAAAALILAAECRLRLDDPVDGLLPELAGMRVLRRPDGPLDDTEPARRPITVRDLLDFRLGTGMIMEEAAFGHPVYRAAHDLDLLGFGPPRPDAPLDPDEWLRRLGTLPLVHQPGERWLYNTGSCVLSVLVARASGQPLGTFLRERIFDPLGMRDTGFTVPAADASRLTGAYTPADGGGLTLFDGAESSPWLREPAFPDGAAGLVSTADDFLAFARSLHRRDGGGVLSRRAVELMTSGQLTAAQREDAFGDARTWGFGVSIATRRDTFSATPGAYGWDGGYGTSWQNDPHEDLIAILMTQRLEYPALNPVYLDFWNTAYQALT